MLKRKRPDCQDGNLILSQRGRLPESQKLHRADAELTHPFDGANGRLRAFSQKPKSLSDRRQAFVMLQKPDRYGLSCCFRRARHERPVQGAASLRPVLRELAQCGRSGHSSCRNQSPLWYGNCVGSSDKSSRSLRFPRVLDTLGPNQSHRRSAPLHSRYQPKRICRYPYSAAHIVV